MLQKRHDKELEDLKNKHKEEIDSLKEELNNLQVKHKEEINSLTRDLETLQKIRNEELLRLNERLRNSHSLYIQKSEFSDVAVSFAWKELLELCNTEYAFRGHLGADLRFAREKEEIIETIKRRFREAIEEQYKYRYLIYLYPEMATVFNGADVVLPAPEQPMAVTARSKDLFTVIELLRKEPKKTEELIYWKNRVSFLEAAKSNLTAIPYMARIMADYETYGLEHLAKELDWGYAAKRMEKVKSIREIRRDAEAIVERNKEAQYQLAYLMELFPNLEDVIDAEFSQLPAFEVKELSDYDAAREYLSKEEYATLSTAERNQLALDRYMSSHKRTKWQIGRDYEMYVGYRYARKGYEVDYFGSYMGLEDLGRDLIAKKDGKVLIIQCKYWSEKKQIHEKHINQLYGTTISYCIEYKVDKEKVKSVLITNTELSPMAKKMASFLGVEYVEKFEKGTYPCIKCNIARGENGETTKIYHLPFDQQYDATKIKNKGEFYASTVAEAEEAGFRRAFKWFGSNR